jgi:hypothetical protein
MNTFKESVAKKIARLLRLFGSDFEGEAVNALMAMRRLAASERLSFNDIAILIENHEGEIEEKKFSDADAAVIYAMGVEQGKADAASRGTILPEDFYHEDGSPRWREIAVWCQERSTRLRPNEQQFIDDMVGRLQWVEREPTAKQGRWLLSIFFQLGGRRKQ